METLILEASRLRRTSVPLCVEGGVFYGESARKLAHRLPASLAVGVRPSAVTLVRLQYGKPAETLGTQSQRLRRPRTFPRTPTKGATLVRLPDPLRPIYAKKGMNYET